MLNQLQTNIHYSFGQVKLLVLALTHSSYSNERAEVEGHNERLEFLGDAVLELCISELLYDTFSQVREGELTAIRSRLVSQGALAAMARKLKLDESLLLGKGEEEQGGRQRDALISDALEAVLGAVFLDGGFSAAQKVVHELFTPLLPLVENKKGPKDNKSLLQEITQKRFHDRPVYTLLGGQGPEHAIIFEVRLDLPDARQFRATGSSVKRAEQAVAALALEELEEHE